MKSCRMIAACAYEARQIQHLTWALSFIDLDAGHIFQSGRAGA